MKCPFLCMGREILSIALWKVSVYLWLDSSGSSGRKHYFQACSWESHLVHVCLLLLSFLICFALVLPLRSSCCATYGCLLAVRKSLYFRWLLKLTEMLRKYRFYPQFRGGDLMCGLFKDPNVLNAAMFPLISNEKSNPQVLEGACSIGKS